MPVSMITRKKSSVKIFQLKNNFNSFNSIYVSGILWRIGKGDKLMIWVFDFVESHLKYILQRGTFINPHSHQQWSNEWYLWAIAPQTYS